MVDELRELVEVIAQSRRFPSRETPKPAFQMWGCGSFVLAGYGQVDAPGGPNNYHTAHDKRQRQRFSWLCWRSTSILLVRTLLPRVYTSNSSIAISDAL